MRANPKLSGTKHNVFGIQTGVAISFMVKRVPTTAATVAGAAVNATHAVAGTGSDALAGAAAAEMGAGTAKPRRRKAVPKKPALLHYYRRPELETAEEKLSFLSHYPLRDLPLELIKPDKNGNWLNQTNNDFSTLLPLLSKETKAAKTAASECAIFKLYSLGTSTNRDEWVIDFDAQALALRMQWFIAQYEQAAKLATHPGQLKWSRNLKRRMAQGRTEEFAPNLIRSTMYRPYVRKSLYDSPLFIDERGVQPSIYGIGCVNKSIQIDTGSTKPFTALAVNDLPDLHFNGDSTTLPLHRYDEKGHQVDNITDWALAQFSSHYADQPGTARRKQKITKESIFHYCYAVLHHPLYREKYAQNLKREFPRIPLYGTLAADFWQWAAWGEALMALHIGYETVAPFALIRTDLPDEKASAAGLPPKVLLRADPASGRITLDSETTLRGIPPEAWDYKLGNRSALDWILDQYKEKKPKDPTIREKFDTYRFADYKEKVIDLLQRVTTVSVETVAIVAAMRLADPG